MVKVIETNISFNNINEIIDFQSRVIEVDGWLEYIEEIKRMDFKLRCCIFGGMCGASTPFDGRIEELQIDNCHLSFACYDEVGNKKKRLAYLA